MSVEKSLYQAPAGIEALAQEEQPLEITIVDPEDVIINGESVLEEDDEDEFNKNLAEDMDERDLQTLGADVIKLFKDDIASRKEWEDMYKQGIKLLGLKIENRTEPWNGACGVFHPMITEAVVRFQSDTIMETFPSSGPVKTQIIGKETPENRDAAQRVQEDMNWQVTENMVEFRPEHERMLWNLPSAGSAFKKVYDDVTLGRQTSVFVPAEDVLLPYGTTELITAPRVTHRMRKTKDEVLKLQTAGFWRDVDLGDPPKVTNDIQKKKDEEAGFTSAYDERFVIYESLIDLDLSGYEDEIDGKPTGIGLPYVLTVNENGTILAIRRNWRKEDKLKLKRQHFVHYQYIPGYGAYGFGLFHLIGGFAQSATSILRQLVDAGTLSNLPGGLKTRGLRIKGDDTPIGPGEFRDVDIGSGGIKDNIMMLPYKEPSQVLAALLDKVIEEGRRMAATGDLKIDAMSNQAPVGTTLALLERTLKVMSAVQARVHYAFKQELRLLADIIRDNADDTEYDYDVDAPQGRRAKESDYAKVEIIPVSDPNAATMTQRVVMYQAVHALSQTAPQIYDLPELHRQMLTAMGVKHVNKLIPTEEDIKNVDPVQENQNILAGKPVKAFAYQDHESHIKVHTMAMQDPLIMQLIGQNPQAQAIMAAASAHVAEHVGFAYRNKMQQALGIPLPLPGPDDEDKELPQDVEYQLSRALAQVAPQILEQSKQVVAQQQAQKNAQDPVLQAQLMEQQTKAAEVQRKAQKDAKDYEIAQGKLMIEAQSKGVDPQQVQAKMALEERQAQARMQLEQQQAEERAALEREKFEHTKETDGIRLGVEIAAKQKQAATAEEAKALNNDIARERHAETLAQQRERHALDQAQKRAKHRADLKARAAAKNKPKEK